MDLLDEVRATAKQQMTQYQDLMAKHYNAKVKPRHFNISDLVLRKVTTATKVSTQGKLGPNWEGPYRIIDCNRKGTYYLEHLTSKGCIILGALSISKDNISGASAAAQVITYVIAYHLCYLFSLSFGLSNLQTNFSADQTTSYQHFTPSSFKWNYYYHLQWRDVYKNKAPLIGKINDQGCLQAPDPHQMLSPTYEMDGWSRMPSSTQSSSNIKSYLWDGLTIKDVLEHLIFIKC